MSAPLPYNITVDFSEEETAQTSGRSTVRTAALDQELSNVNLSITSLTTRSTAIQRDDNQLLDGIVRYWALAADVLSLISAAGWVIRGAWLTTTVYAARDFVTNGTGTYVCMVAHTAGVFATDLAAGKWATVFDTATFSASNVTFTPVGTIAASNVQAAIAEAASDAVQKAANLSDVTAATARTNLSVPSILQMQELAFTKVTIGGTANAMTGALAGSPRADLLTDFAVLGAAVGPNTSTVPTYDQDGLGAKVIKKHDLSALEDSDIAGVGHVIHLYWSAANDCYLLLNPAIPGLTARERVAIKLALFQLSR